MLSVDSIKVGYGNSMVLREVSLTVSAGEVVCLLGRNGVGKSTLVKAIMGLLRTRSGHIDWKGRKLEGVPPEQRARAGIGYVPQGREIFPHLTVRENLLLGTEARGGRSAASAMEDVIRLFPPLRGLLGRKGGALSGGQQQQLAIARALIGEPELLLMDEPREGIQPSIVLEIERVIAQIKAQQTTAILLVEQNVEFALEAADRYYVIDRGEIVAHGRAADADVETLTKYIAV